VPTEATFVRDNSILLERIQVDLEVTNQDYSRGKNLLAIEENTLSSIYHQTI
jgi:hypothetical protein